ncbi:hypothetical protein JK386_13150 [Nocardioides sp. zg-536]|uniref:Uncharacterized protein n=1 Tax=Nocardioides faecalis TaxID=2803858 RepID=A0A938YBL1_9ACTN|nr:hypothetical protein [Nocardioides faecalis]QVI60681.1 hypothetical protein KG111_13525 [Nocardioides faecalis]
MHQSRLGHGARRRLRRRDQRGDVPGWVLVTVMTISIGVALWGVAQPQMVGILQSALNSVK